MAYNTTTGIISQPVSIDDIRRCFFVTLRRTRTDNGATESIVSGDLGTICSASVGDTITALDGKGNWTVTSRREINIWSQTKPIYHTKIPQLTTDDRKGRALSGYKTGAGIRKRAYVWADYIDGKDTSTGSVESQVWALDRPVADGRCAFRLTDFAGYYHLVGRTFNVYTLFGNVSNILIPSTSSGQGTNIAFSIGFSNPIADGAITPQVLFGDCWDYYPAVILTNGSTGGNSYQYAKTADSPISAYVSSPVTINIDTADFVNAIAADFRQLHSGDPFDSYPLRTGDKWTACMVLLSQPLVDTHKVPSGVTIVRLEYESNADRRTLPIKQSKYNNIEWMKMTVKITKIVGYQRKYKIDSIVVTAKMLTTAAISFSVNAALSTPQGTVNVSGASSGQSVTVNNYSNVQFSGTVGEVTKNLGISETTWDVTATTSGNMLCNGTLTFHHSNGDFQGGFSFDVTYQQPEYTISDISLL